MKSQEPQELEEAAEYLQRLGQKASAIVGTMLHCYGMCGPWESSYAVLDHYCFWLLPSNLKRWRPRVSRMASPDAVLKS